MAAIQSHIATEICRSLYTPSLTIHVQRCTAAAQGPIYTGMYNISGGPATHQEPHQLHVVTAQRLQVGHLWYTSLQVGV
jgi:hypothetical protein